MSTNHAKIPISIVATLRQIRIWCVACCIVAGSVAGCGWGQPEPTAAELVDRAASSLDTLKSVHFLLVIEGGPAFLDAGRTLNLRQAEGDILRPDRAQAVAKVAVTGFVLNVRFINIGAEGYMTNPLSGRWEAAPAGLGYNATYLFDQQQGVAAIIRQIEGITRAGEQRVDEVAAYHLIGEIRTDKLLVLTGGVLPGERVKADLWVAKEGGIVRQIRLTEIGAAKAPMTWTLALSRHDQPVSIEPPPR
jgi:hypothetical protein